MTNRSAMLTLAGLFLTVLAAACGSAPSVSPDAAGPPSMLPGASPGVASVTVAGETSPAEAPPRSDPVRIGAAAMGHVRALSVDLGPRDSESGGEARAAAYLEREFRAVGLEPRRQTFSVGIFSRETPRLSVAAPAARNINAEPMGRTGEGTAEGRLVFAGLGAAADMPADGFGGSVALLERGAIRFQEKAENARRAGASAVVVYNNTAGALFGSLLNGVGIPVVGVSRSDGQALRALMAQGDVVVRVTVKRVELPSQNVIAEVPGGAPGLVIIGGHYDSVPEVSGANDNASGTAVMLALAKELPAKRYPFTVRLIGFGGEELDLWGSREHVSSLPASERQSVRAVFNLDVVGAAVPLGVSGTDSLAQVVREQAQRAGITMRTITEDVPSDHLPFINEGIPAVIITTPDFSVIHTPEDTQDRIVPARLGETAVLVLRALDALALASR